MTGPLLRPDDFAAALAHAGVLIARPPGHRPLIFVNGPDPRQVTVVQADRAETLHLDGPLAGLEGGVYRVCPGSWSWAMGVVRWLVTAKATGNPIFDWRPPAEIPGRWQAAIAQDMAASKDWRPPPELTP